MSYFKEHHYLEKQHSQANKKCFFLAETYVEYDIPESLIKYSTSKQIITVHTKS